MTRIIAAFLLVLFLGFRGATTFFMHSHTLDGVVFVHSHPGSGTTHHHTALQFQALSMLAHVDASDPAVGLPGLVAPSSVACVFHVRPICAVAARCGCSALLRAPPASMSI